MNPINDSTIDQTEQNEINANGSILPTATPRTDLGPTTDYDSRKVMLRAERNDVIDLVDVEQHFSENGLPETLTVIERTETYFGPELLLESDGRNYLLTAPGPDTQLLLWSEIVNERSFREQWSRLAEVRVSLKETPQYDICDQCGYPIRSKEHERLSTIGRCPNGSATN